MSGMLQPGWWPVMLLMQAGPHVQEALSPTYHTSTSQHFLGSSSSHLLQVLCGEAGCPTCFPGFLKAHLSPQLCRRQDEDLDQLGNQVQRIGHMGLQINEELTSQNDLIEQLDEDVEGTSSRLAAAQKKMNSVLKKAGLKGQIMIIVFLLVLLIILILIAFS